MNSRAHLPKGSHSQAVQMETSRQCRSALQGPGSWAASAHSWAAFVCTEGTRGGGLHRLLLLRHPAFCNSGKCPGIWDRPTSIQRLGISSPGKTTRHFTRIQVTANSPPHPTTGPPRDMPLRWGGGGPETAGAPPEPAVTTRCYLCSLVNDNSSDFFKTLLDALGNAEMDVT